MKNNSQKTPEDDRYSTLIGYNKLQKMIKMRGYSNIWEIKEFDEKRGYRISYISSDFPEPINETRFIERK